MVNARLGWESADKTWGVSVEGENLLDKQYYINETVSLSSYGYLVGQPGVPRTVMVSLRRNF
jgi:iron complex outermembrane recepter protein